MSAIVLRSSIAIRVATMSDLAFMDALQKKHSKQLGYFPTKQFKSYIEQGAVLIAEEPSPQPSPGIPGEGVRVGYVISKDRYLKRDELGVIYQLCVVPGEQRKLVGASLIKEVFARSAYGCRLYCCWCAQDIAANYFWESLGFIPIAFRAGSGRKKRVHIFWQRRINADDETTRYWYPSQTNAGAIREDRLVFPIPPGVHWNDVMPVVLPGVQSVATVEKKRRALPAAKMSAPLTPENAAMVRSQSKHLQGVPAGKVAVLTGGRIRYIPRAGYIAPLESAEVAKATREKIKQPKQKNDPKHIAAARELRDRYLEQVNEGPHLLSQGKYDVRRVTSGKSQPMLPLAA